jgi:hypothetical protein
MYWKRIIDWAVIAALCSLIIATLAIAAGQLRAAGM